MGYGERVARCLVLCMSSLEGPRGRPLEFADIFDVIGVSVAPYECLVPALVPDTSLECPRLERRSPLGTVVPLLEVG